MENIPDSVQQEEIGALLLGLRFHYQSMVELTEVMCLDWQAGLGLEDFKLLQQQARLTELLLRQINTYPVFQEFMRKKVRNR